MAADVCREWIRKGLTVDPYRMGVQGIIDGEVCKLKRPQARTDGGLPWRGGGAYGLRGSCRLCFLEIQRGGDY